jgi:Protein of unknown function (DUF1769)
MLMMLCLGYIHDSAYLTEYKNDFDDSIADKLPTGTSLGMKALKIIDSSIEADLYSSKPYAPTLRD